MNKFSAEIKSGKLFFQGLFTVLLSINFSLLTAQPFKVFAVSDMVRVFEDGYNLPSAGDTIKIFGIRGEILSGQITINAKNNLTKVSVDPGVLKNQKTGKIIGSVEWNFVGTIPLTENTRGYELTALTRKAPAQFPEYLMQEKQLNINKNTYKSVWLTISVPENADPGLYSAGMKVTSSQGEQSIPLKLMIYPLTLPSERHLDVVEWFSTRGFSKWHGINEEYSPEWFAMLKKYGENLAAHRQNSFRVGLNTIEIKRSKEGDYSFDFTRFDQISDLFWNIKGMDYLETGFLAKRGPKGFTDPHIAWVDVNMKNAETGQQFRMRADSIIPYLIPALENHLRQKGWLKKTWYHIFDESVLMNAPSYVEFSNYIHQYGPDLKRMDAIETTALLDAIEIAVPKLNHFASWYDTYRKAGEKGVEMWFYTVGIYQGSLYPNKTIDVPLIQSRTMHWLNYRFDAPGYLHWGYNSWTEDPFNEVGMHIGDGWHVYPAKDGVLNSLRWEEMRNGIQDYEYFWMLENKINQLKDSLGTQFLWIDPKQRGQEITARVIKDFEDYSNDPDVLNAAKMEVIKELVMFDASPKVYVQTRPFEGSELFRQASVELFGWCEPGTKINVNGEDIWVRQNGLFLAKPSTAGRVNEIKITATSLKGTKVITRKIAER